MGSRSKIIIAFVVMLLLGFSGSFAMMQETGPAAAPPPREAGQIDLGHITLSTPEGTIAAIATVAQSSTGITITISSHDNSGLAPGKHGVHIHRVGACDASGSQPFSSAGDHFNPANNEHGEAKSDDSHAGDLGNLTVKDDGTIDFKITTNEVSLQPGASNSLDNPGGSSIVIHANEDDESTQPSGNSGAREACGIIFRSQEPVTHYMPNAGATPSPAGAIPAATPES